MRTQHGEENHRLSPDHQGAARKSWLLALTRFRHNRLAMIGVGIAVFTLLLALLAPVLAPYDPAATDFVHINTWPNRHHPFGTDPSGSDIFSMMLLSLRTSYTVVLIAQVITVVIGVAVGLASGYWGGWVDTLLSRLIDALFSFPNIIVAILIAGTFGVPMYQKYGSAGRLYLTVVALSLFGWAGLARIIRAEVLRLREQPYVEASIVAGGRGWWIIKRHMLPNVLGITSVLSSSGVGASLTLEATLAYLGLGVTVPTPSLGRLIQAGQAYIDPFWYQFLFPAMVLVSMVLAYAFIGDGLRDAIDPHR